MDYKFIVNSLINEVIHPLHIVNPRCIDVYHHVLEVVLQLPDVLQFFHVGIHVRPEGVLEFTLFIFNFIKHLRFVVS